MNPTRFVFIIGFERCMTTSLANYLTDNRYCNMLVDGIKEPGIFYGHQDLANQIVSRRTKDGAGSLFLDASVSYVTYPPALRAIAQTCTQARIIVCLRAPFQRMLSAYRYYKALHVQPMGDAARILDRGHLDDGTPIPRQLLELTVPRDSWVATLALMYFQAFGTVADGLTEDYETLAKNKSAPAYLSRPPMGRYLFSALVAALEAIDPVTLNGKTRLEQLDRNVERFNQASLPEIILYELRKQRRDGSLPELSIVRNSFFSYALASVLEIFEPSQVMVATMDHLPGESAMDARLREFLRVEKKSAHVPFSRSNDTSGYKNIPTPVEINQAGSILENAFREDTRRVHDLLANHPGVDLSLYTPSTT